VAIEDGLDDWQTQPRALTFGLGRLEGLEYELEIFVGNTAPGILYQDLHAGAIFGDAYLQIQPALGLPLHGLSGIDDQIAQRLFDLIRVSHDRRQVGGTRTGMRRPSLCRW